MQCCTLMQSECVANNNCAFGLFNADLCMLMPVVVMWGKEAGKTLRAARWHWNVFVLSPTVMLGCLLLLDEHTAMYDRRYLCCQVAPSF